MVGPAKRLRVAGILDVLLGLLICLLGFQLTVRSRAQGLDGPAQAHALGAGVGRYRALVAGGSGHSGHIGFHTAKGDAQVLADVSRGYALSQVLESGTGVLRRHAGQRLELAGQCRVFSELLAHGHAVRGGARRIVAHAMRAALAHRRVHACTRAHAMAVLRKSRAAA